jgi:hypothetical protein
VRVASSSASWFGLRTNRPCQLRRNPRAAAPVRRRTPAAPGAGIHLAARAVSRVGAQARMEKPHGNQQPVSHR